MTLISFLPKCGCPLRLLLLAPHKARSIHLGNQNANDDGQLVECPQGTPKMSGGDFSHIHGHQP